MITPASDIYSLGVLLYELLTGHRPYRFRSLTPQEIEHVVCEEAPEKPSLVIGRVEEAPDRDHTHTPASVSETCDGQPEKLRRSLAGDLDNIVLMALRKEPERRYGSVEQLSEDIHRHLEGLPVIARKDALWYRSAKFIKAVPAFALDAHMSIPGRWAWFALLLVAGFFAWRPWRATDSAQPLRAVPLTALPGAHRYPSFSPDGSHVAFTWTGPKQDNQDVYVQQVDSGSPSRRTTDPRMDYNPVWSPDGRWIAFLRRQWKTGTSELLLIPPLAGTERKLTDIRVSETYAAPPPYLAWCPDSKCLVIAESPGEGKPAALFVHPLEWGEKRALTHPKFPAIGDTSPAVSPDGNWLVFRRQTSLHTSELYGLPLGKDSGSGGSAEPAGLTAVGEPQQLTTAAMDAGYPTWTPDSKEILFSARESLWRLLVPGKNTPARLPFAGEDGIMPVVSRLQSGRAHLAYVRSFQDTDIWRVEVPGPGTPASAPPARAISSTRRDSTPQLSPDERRVVFVSDRSGAWEIWVADADGSNAVRLSYMQSSVGAPCWSPKGERIVFQANLEGQNDVYVVLPQSTVGDLSSIASNKITCFHFSAKRN